MKIVVLALLYGVFCVGLLVGCGGGSIGGQLADSGSSAVDAGFARDAGPIADAASDGGSTLDADPMPTPDAAPTPDAGESPDAEATPDAQAALDAETPDAQAVLDAETPDAELTDGPADASTSPDAGFADVGFPSDAGALPDAGANPSYDPTTTERLDVPAPGGAITLIVPRTAIAPAEVGVVVNLLDPQSLAVAAVYQRRHGIPAQNRIELSFPPAPGIDRALLGTLKTELDARAAQIGGLQALAITWTNPFQVEGESITSALSFGFDPAYVSVGTCSQTRASPYFASRSTRPYTDHGFRPAMMVAGTSSAAATQLIDRALLAAQTFPRGPGFVVRTNDNARSAPRAYDFRYSEESFGGRPDGLEILRVDNLGGPSGGNTIPGERDLLFYFTGLTNVADLGTNSFVPGAVADHLTSFGGVLSGAGQMTVLSWLAAGASGSFGTVREPCAYAEKFPVTHRMIGAYLGGATLIEAYWRSVRWPGEGLFVGDPLTRPFGTRATSVAGGQLEIVTSILEPGRRYAFYGAPALGGPFTRLEAVSAQESQAIVTLRRAADHPVLMLVDEGPVIDPWASGVSGNAVLSGEDLLIEAVGGGVVLASPRTGQLELSGPTSGGGLNVSPSPRLAGTKAAWFSRRGALALELEDTLTREHRRVDLAGAAAFQGVAVSGDRVVWSDNRNGSLDVFVYDWSTGATTPVFVGPQDQTSPTISGTLVAWVDRATGQEGLVVLDLAGGSLRRLPRPAAPATDAFPALEGNRLVFARGESGERGYTRLYQLDLSGGTEERLDPGHDFQGVPSISPDLIVWTDTRHEDGDVYQYDRRTAQISRLTTERDNQLAPSVSGRRVSWASASGVFLLDPAPAADQAPILRRPPDAVVVSVGDEVLRHLLGEDPEHGALSYRARLPSGQPLATAGADFSVVRLGDVDASGAADAGDLALVRQALGRARGDVGYEARLDLDDDGVVGPADVELVLGGIVRPRDAGLLRWTASLAAQGLRTAVILGATDGTAHQTELGLAIDWDQAPAFVDLRDRTATVAQALHFFVRAADPDPLDRITRIEGSLSTGAPLADIGAQLSVGPLGDLDGNGVFNSIDVGMFRRQLGLPRGDPGYDPRADFNADGVVDGADSAVFSASASGLAGYFSWTPSAAGTFALRFRAWDNRGAVALQAVTIAVH